MVRPPNLEHAVVQVDILQLTIIKAMFVLTAQAMGRAGRLTSTGQRGFSLLYLLYNAQDLGANVAGLSRVVDQLCRGEGCKKLLLRSSFVGEYAAELTPGENCCSACDMES